MKTGNVPLNGKGAETPEQLTTAQRRARRNMAELAQGWDELEDWERDEWWRRSNRIRIRIHRRKDPQAYLKPRTRAMRGEELYIKINRVLNLCGSERVRLPPPPPEFRGNPVQPKLKITISNARLRIKLVLRGVPKNDIMVFGSPPRRPGQGPGGDYAFLGLLPRPRRGECDITDMYLQKLREWLRLPSAVYHVPLEGARICIRTWPQDHGWEGKGWLMISHGLVRRAN